MSDEEQSTEASDSAQKRNGRLTNTILALAVIGLFVFNWDIVRSLLFAPTEYSQHHNEGVFLYATQWCGYCKKTRRFLEAENIDYIEYDIEKSAVGRQQYEEMNGRGIPLVVANGIVIRGYSPQRIITALRENNPARDQPLQ